MISLTLTCCTFSISEIRSFGRSLGWACIAIVRKDDMPLLKRCRRPSFEPARRRQQTPGALDSSLKKHLKERGVALRIFS